jgi:hypothetical protein
MPATPNGNVVSEILSSGTIAAATVSPAAGALASTTVTMPGASGVGAKVTFYEADADPHVPATPRVLGSDRNSWPSGATRLSHITVGANDAVTVTFHGNITEGNNIALRWWVYRPL